MKDFILVFACSVALGLLIAYLIPKDTVADWEVQVVFQNGDTTHLLLFDQKCPVVEKSGCLYDYYHKSYICGVRSIYVVPVDNQQ